MKMTKKKYYLTQEEINDSYETISTAVPDKVRLAILLKNKGVKFENVSSLTFLVEPIFSGTIETYEDFDTNTLHYIQELP